MKNNKGISLIALVITIIVIIILAAAVILTINNNNPMNNANEATFKSNISAYKDELTLGLIEGDTLKVNNVGIGEVENGDYKIKKVITSMTEKDVARFGINNNQLVYSPEFFSDQEKIWLGESQVEPVLEGDSIKLENCEASNIEYVRVKGKSTQITQLYDSGKKSDYYLDEKGNIAYNPLGGYYTTEYIEVVPGFDYVYSGEKLINDKNVYSAIYDENKNLISTFLTKSGENVITNLPSNASYIRFSFWMMETSFSFKLKNISTEKMLKSPVKISNLSNFNIKTTGKNMVDFRTLYNSFKSKIYFDTNFEHALYNNGFKAVVTKNIPSLVYSDLGALYVENGKKYKFSYNYEGSTSDYIEFWGKHGAKSLKVIGFTNDTVNKKITYILESKKDETDITNIMWYFAVNSTVYAGQGGTYTNFQFYEIENQEDEEEYTEHHSSEVYIPYSLYDLPDGTADILYLDNLSKKMFIERKVGILELTGNENWNIQESNDNYMLFTTKEYDNLMYDNKINTNKNTYSTHFLPLSYQSILSLNDNGINIYNDGKGDLKIAISKNTASSVVEFKKWLSDNKASGKAIQVYYTLKNNIKENITYEGNLELYNDYTRIYKTGISSNIAITLKK